MGFGVEFDLFGFLIWNVGNFLHVPTDTQRVQTIIKLAEFGYASQLFVSHDVCMKMQRPDWGGFGYDHLLTNVAPVFDTCGAPPGLADQLSRDNPRRLLCWAEDDVPG